MVYTLISFISLWGASVCQHITIANHRYWGGITLLMWSNTGNIGIVIFIINCMLTNWQSVGLCQYLWPWVLKSYTDIILQSSMVPNYWLLFNLRFWFSSYLLCECHWLCQLCNCNLIFKRKTYIVWLTLLFIFVNILM